MFVTSVLPLVGLSLALAVVGQMLLRTGMSQVTTALPEGAGPVAVLLKAFVTPLVLVGLAGYVGSALSWLLVLSRAELSLVYPFVGLTMVLVALASRIFLGESISAMRWVGMLIVVGGITIVARS